jgi:radical SAM superfamily enzyme YgiQ (UPF0313 family)
VSDLESYLASASPDVVGFGTYQRNIAHVRALSRSVKKRLPRAAVVLGGPQATFLPDAALTVMPEVDYISRGEGELVIRAIVGSLDAGRDGAAVPGATSRLADGSIATGEPETPPADLDVYPSPWMSGVLDPAAAEESILLTSRGCPNRCAFCTTPASFGGKVRCHSVERVLEEISYVSKRGNGRLWFADPNFSFSRNRVVEILEGILKRNLQVGMWIETRADMLDAELIRLLKRAGVHTVAMGLESASPEVIPGLCKDLEPELIRKATVDAIGAGLEVELFSQFALPGESHEDALATLEFVKGCGVKIRGNSNAQQMQVYLGSEISGTPGKFGVRPLRESYPPWLSIGTEYETDWMSRDEIDRVRSAWLAESVDGGKRIVS